MYESLQIYKLTLCLRSLEFWRLFSMQAAINCVFVVQMMECPTSLHMVDFEREKRTSLL